MKRLIAYINRQFIPAQTCKEECMRAIKMFGALAGLFLTASITINTDVSMPVFMLGIVGCIVFSVLGFIHSNI